LHFFVAFLFGDMYNHSCMALINPLDAAKTELDTLLRQATEINSRIEAVREAIKILEPLYGNPMPMPAWWEAASLNNSGPLSSLNTLAEMADGLTHRIRKVLRSHAGQPLTPVDVRDLIVASGFDLSGKSNAMAEIHQILKRIVSDPQFVTFTTLNGTVYKFDPSIPPRALNRYRSAEEKK
jgi:hypothetical protein